MSKPVIISGEASETDSENEVEVETQSSRKVNLTCESDPNTSVNSASSALAYLDIDIKPPSPFVESKSLLHQKQKETNIRLYNNFSGLINTTTDDAGRTLFIADQQIMKSQVTLQNTVTTLKNLSSTSLALEKKLHALISSNFLSNINS